MQVESKRGGVVPGQSTLPGQLQLPMAVAAVFSALTVVILCLLYAGDGTPTSIDAWIRAQTADLGSPWRQFSLVIDYLAEPVGGTLVLIALVTTCLKLGHRRAAVLALAGPGVTVAVTTLLKPLVDRTINGGFHAFPSGHTAMATAVALIVVLVLVDRRQVAATAGMVLVVVVTVPAAALMACAQVVLNAHYLTDTFGGFCAALAVLPPTAWVIDRIADRRMTFRPDHGRESRR